MTAVTDLARLWTARALLAIAELCAGLARALLTLSGWLSRMARKLASVQPKE